MEIRLAKTAGFCFGVNRAVELTYNLLDGGHKVATLGPLIHNPQAVADMERRGALVADTVDDIPAGYEVIIRSHGVPRSIYDTLEQRALVYHDATCPFVKKIHRIARHFFQKRCFFSCMRDNRYLKSLFLYFCHRQADAIYTDGAFFYDQM